MPRKAPGRDPPPYDLLAAAETLTAGPGPGALSVRSLARVLGVSMGALSKRLGSRADILAAVGGAAADREAQRLAIWRDRIRGYGPLDAVSAAEIAESVLESSVTEARPLSLILGELVHASRWDPAAAAAAGPLYAAHAEFWRDLSWTAGVADDLIESGFVEGYALDETAFGLSLDGNWAYRRLRRLGLRCLFAGFHGGGPQSVGFDQAYAALEYPVNALFVRHGVHQPPDWRRAAAAAAARLITHKGVDAVSHRAVGEDAGVPHTTLAYRFPTHEDLVVAGLEHIIAELLESVSGEAGLREVADAAAAEGVDVGAATFAIALAAARDPKFAPCAGDMRRQRGVNLARLVTPDVGPPLTLLEAQAMAIGLIGAANAPASPGRLPATTPARVELALEWRAGRIAP